MKIKGFPAALVSGFLMLNFFNLTSALVPLPFSDVMTDHPNFDAIMYLKDSGIISGYPDGTFKPDQEVNRVEALKIILLGSKVEVPETTVKPIFSDTKAGEWYVKYLIKAAELKIVEGYPDGTFRPLKTVNLVENLKMLINTKRIDLSGVEVNSHPFADASAGEWYSKFVQYAKTNSWITADAENKIYPDQGMTRAKLAQLIYNSLPKDIEPAPEPTQQVTQQTTQQTNQQSDYVLNVKIESAGYTKSTMTIGKGTTVKWTNLDSANHTVTSDTSVFTSPTLKNGETWTYTFNTIGTFNYHCTLNPALKGTITVKASNEVPTI